MGAVPVFAPADSAIPAPEIPAPAQFERQLGDDRKLLQRERKEGIPNWSIIAFGLGVAVFVLALLLAAGFALIRVSRAGSLAHGERSLGDHRVPVVEHQPHDVIAGVKTT